MLLDSSFEYALKKSSAPSVSHKAHWKQKYLHRRAGEQNSLIKICHMKNEPADQSKSKVQNDFATCVIYSLNKGQRWEIPENLGVGILDQLQDFNNGIDVVVIEHDFDGLFGSQWTKYVHRVQDHLISSKVKRVHYIEPQYSVKTYKGAGAKHIAIEKSDDVISYNLFEVPKNYMKLYENEMENCRCNGCHKYPISEESFTTKKAMREFWDNEFGMEDYEYIYGWTKEDLEEELEEEVEKEKKYYNLEEHWISKKRTKSSCYGFLIV